MSLKTISRTAYALRQRVGVAEKTVDTEFEEERERWRRISEEAAAVVAGLHSQSRAICHIVMPVQKMADDVRRFYGESSTLGSQFVACTRVLTEATAKYMEEHTIAVAAVEKFIATLDDLKDQMAARDERLLDCDRYSTALQSAQKTRDIGKIQAAEAKFESQKEAYLQFNSALVLKMREVFASRSADFETPALSAMRAGAKLCKASSVAFLALHTRRPPKPAGSAAAIAAAAASQPPIIASTQAPVVVASSEAAQTPVAPAAAPLMSPSSGRPSHIPPAPSTELPLPPHPKTAAPLPQQQPSPGSGAPEASVSQDTPPERPEKPHHHGIAFGVPLLGIAKPAVPQSAAPSMPPDGAVPPLAAAVATAPVTQAPSTPTGAVPSPPDESAPPRPPKPTA